MAFENNPNSHALISFRAVFAGLLIAFFTMTGLIGLGLAFGGMGLADGSTIRNAGIFTGLWFVVSAFMSIFSGCYFAARISRFRTPRVGSAQGLVIAALFLGFFFYQTLATIGAAGSLVGSFVGKTAGVMGSGIATLAENPNITKGISNMTEDALGDLNFRSRPQVVATGVVNRLVQGDTEGAKNYLAREARITPAEADQRIAGLRVKLDETIVRTREGAASALRSTGITLFLLVILGTVAAIFGGAWGSSANYRKPFKRDTFLGDRSTQASY